MKVALVHDWLTGMRGGERVLEAFCELLPDAEIFTLFHFKGTVSALIESHKIHTSFLQGFAHRKWYRYLLPFMPVAVESLNVKEFDLVISSSHCVAKGVVPPPNAVHFCYCHTPMRYLWHMRDEYFRKDWKSHLEGFAMFLLGPYLKMWDVKNSNRIHYFIANSENTKNRIKKYYGRDSSVIYPPIDTEKFYLGRQRDGFYLIVSAFAPYKRVDIAIEAFNKLGLPLKIIGTGQEERRLKSIAKANIEFLGWQADEVVAKYYSECSALIFPGEEDFGIVPLEAMASGKPVIAFARGGVLESVLPLNNNNNNFDTATGVFFHEQAPNALFDAVRQFEKIKENFSPEIIRNHALLFDKKIFKKNIKEFTENKMADAKKI